LWLFIHNILKQYRVSGGLFPVIAELGVSIGKLCFSELSYGFVQIFSPYHSISMQMWVCV